MSKEVIDLALLFLNSNISLKKINHTNIVIIPKVKIPSRIIEFRSMSLCNVCYKIIAKIQKMLPQLIDESQSDFVKRKLITDNVIVVVEIFQ